MDQQPVSSPSKPLAPLLLLVTTLITCLMLQSHARIAAAMPVFHFNDWFDRFMTEDDAWSLGQSQMAVSAAITAPSPSTPTLSVKSASSPVQSVADKAVSYVTMQPTSPAASVMPQPAVATSAATAADAKTAPKDTASFAVHGFTPQIANFTTTPRHLSNNSYPTKDAQKLAAKVESVLRKNEVYVPKALIESEQKRRAISPAELSTLENRVAAGFMHAGKIQEARAWSAAAIAADPNALWTYGLTAWKQHDMAVAASAFTALAEHTDKASPNHAAASYWAYRAYQQQGDEADANRWLQEAALQPHSFYGFLAGSLLGWIDAGAKTSEISLYPLPPWQPQGGFHTDRALLFALARHESGFNPAAVSPQGACGLMQLMPATAQLLSDEKLEHGCTGHLRDPAFNLGIGQSYVQNLGTDPLIGDNLIMLLTAYNDGPAHLPEWLNDETRKDPLLFIETMPVAETRGYVEQVMVHYWMYRARLGQPLTSLAQLAKGNWPRYTLRDETAHEIKNAKLAPNQPAPGSGSFAVADTGAALH